VKVRPGCAHAVDPGLELAGDREVVERRADHNDIGGQQLGNQCLGHGVFTFLHFRQRRSTGRRTETDGVGRQVVRGVHRQVEIVDHGPGVTGTPLADDVAGELARNGVGAEDAGVDVKQFHDEVL
jgi:hypothetical protein